MSIILAKIAKKAFRKRHLDTQKVDIAVGQRETQYSKMHPAGSSDIPASTGSVEPRTPFLNILGNRISNIRNLGFGIIKEIESG